MQNPSNPSSLRPTSPIAKFAAMTNAPSKSLLTPSGSPPRSWPSKPNNSPAIGNKCFHRGLRSSAPFTTALTHSVRSKCRRCLDSCDCCCCPGGGAGSPSWSIARLADWKIPRTRRQTRRPSGWSQRAVAVRIWEVRRVTLRGLVRVVRRMAEVENSLLELA
jgi:hypothetical protein